MPPETVSTQSEVASQLPPTPPKNNRALYICLGAFAIVIIGGIVTWAYMSQFTERQNYSIPQTQTNLITPVSENERIQIFSKFSPSFMQNPLSFADYTVSNDEYRKGYSAQYTSKT